MRQTEKRRLRNRANRTSLRTIVAKSRTASVGTDAPAAQDAFKMAAKRLDQAAAKHLIHKNKASRLKSRLARRLAKGGAAAPASK